MNYTLQELASLTDAQLIGDPNHCISGVDNLETASSHEAAFLENARYEKQLASSQAGVILIHPSAQRLPEKNYLLTSTPSLAFQKIIELFISTPASGFFGIHSTAVIHAEAYLGPDVTIGPYAVIDRAAKIGAKSTIGPGCFIGAGAIVGSECYFYANSTVREGCEIGNRVILQPGAVVGSCGFGYFTDNTGKHIFLTQLGKVIIEDDVKIGANTTIDRARFKTTRVRRGTKIDNLVQIAHQVELGEDNMVAAQVGFAGSTKTGKNLTCGGQAGFAGHLEITNGVTVAARCAVSKSLLKPGVYSGIPAAPIREANMQFVQLRSISKLIERLKELEGKVKELESTIKAI